MLAMTGSSSVLPSNTMRTQRPRLRAFSAGIRNSLRAAGVRGLVKISATSPCSAIRPPSMIATWVQIWRMTCISWVIMTMVMPRRRLMSCSSERMDCVVIGSSALVASSHSSTSGLVASARAMATRCFWPPDSCAGYALAFSSRPTSASSSLARSRALSRGTPAISSGKNTFFSTVRCMSRLNCWKIMPTLRRIASKSRSPAVRMFLPWMRMRPSVGASKRLMQRMSVDLPAPLIPIMPNMSPLRMLRSIPSSATMSPPCAGNVLCTPWMSITTGSSSRFCTA